MAESTKKPNIFQRWARSFKDMRGEMKKVVWPTKKQVWNNTLIVLAVVLIAGIVICGLDMLFSLVIKLLLKA
ncbi:MAG: preprotein translocase subunit SecE [Angelakisella sp.]|nr:preprotein translocase subunit SecE [Angelakisella sp.]